MKPRSRIHRATDGLVFEGLGTYCLEEKKEKKQEKEGKGNETALAIERGD